jgi:hypothetical protein
MKSLFMLMCLAEAATGVALMVIPSVVARLLLGTELTGVAVPLGRVAGAALLSLGLACWPDAKLTRSALCGMLTYNSLVALYLLSLGIRGDWVGPLLWPAMGLHAIFTALLTRSWIRAGRTES